MFVLKFKPIPSFENYLINYSGQVYNTKTKQFVRAIIDRYGYLRVKLYKAGKGFNKRIARLVSEAFVNGYSTALEVNHLDCNKLNNWAWNLEMTTRSQNIKHAWKNGRMKLTKRDEKGRFSV